MIWCRHPVERVISWYYYIRQNWYPLNWDDDRNSFYNNTKLNGLRTLNPSKYKMTFEECVLAKDPACSYPKGSTVTHNDGEKSFWGQVLLNRLF